MSDAPVFLLGTERSGSNLLRLILNAHSRIHVPHPPHVVRYFDPLEASYGDLSDPERFDLLVRDVLRLLRVHIHPWTLQPTIAEVVARAPSRSVFGVYAALQDLSRTQVGKARWGCKSTFMIHHVDTVLAHFPDARFVHLVRDPRDVAVSSRKSVFSPFHPYYTAQLWRSQQDLGLTWETRLPATAWRRVRYEDLLASPEETVRDLCAFLDEPFESQMLRFFETDDARTSARLSESWKNTGSPILTGNTEKFLKDLSAAELSIVEQICAPTMVRLGYTPLTLDAEAAATWTPPPGSPAAPSLPRRAGYRLQDQAWRAQVEWRSLHNDENHWRRWARDATVRALQIQARLRTRRGP